MNEVKLEIVMLPNGSVNVTGPLTNKLLCLGMLELAKKPIHEFDPNQTPGILIARQTGLTNGQG